MKYKLILSIALSLSVLSLNAKEIVITKAPIPIRLPVGEEVRIEFPDTVIDFNMDSEADYKSETLLKADGTLLWRAKERFPESRALATTAKGEVIVLDVKTGISQDKVIKLTHKKPVKKVPEKKVETATKEKPSETVEQKEQDPYALMPPFLREQYDGVSTPKVATYSYADMAAFAMQHYIGPTRLIENIPVQRVQLKAPKGRLIRVWGGEIRLFLLNQWTLNDQYITAIKVKNISTVPFRFDPRAIRGRYLFVASLHDVLQPHGSAEDETVWVFITSEPFSKAFQQ